jgi:hypothetical protein
MGPFMVVACVGVARAFLAFGPTQEWCTFVSELVEVMLVLNASRESPSSAAARIVQQTSAPFNHMCLGRQLFGCGSAGTPKVFLHFV